MNWSVVEKDLPDLHVDRMGVPKDSKEKQTELDLAVEGLDPTPYTEKLTESDEETDSGEGTSGESEELEESGSEESTSGEPSPKQPKLEESALKDPSSEKPKLEHSNPEDATSQKWRKDQLVRFVQFASPLMPNPTTPYLKELLQTVCSWAYSMHRRWRAGAPNPCPAIVWRIS